MTINISINESKSNMISYLTEEFKKSQRNTQKTSRKKIEVHLKEYSDELISLEYENLQKLYQTAIHNADQKFFFHQPETTANWCYWCRMHTWTLNQAIILLLGKDPQMISCERLNILLNDFHFQHHSPFISKYKMIKNLALNYFGRNFHKIESSLLEMEIEPQKFIGWATKIDIPLPHELVESLEKYINRSLTFESITKELADQKLAVQGIRLQEIIDADCLTPGLQGILLTVVYKWVHCFKKGKIEYPTREDVIAELEKQGFSPSAAKAIAPYLKPEWGPSNAGRPPK